MWAFRCLLVVSLITMLGLGGAVADDQVARPTLALAGMATLPVIDGDLSDAGWKKIEPVLLRTFPGGGRPKESTAVRIGTDGVWLYIAFDCEDSTLISPEQREYRNDTHISNNDGVEFFIDPGTAGSKYFHFMVAPNGDRFEQACTVLAGGKQIEKVKAFNPHWRSAGLKTERGYTIEAAIPLLYFLKSGGTGDTWGANFCRQDTSPGDISPSQRRFFSWAPLQRGFHEPASFGRLVDLPSEMKAEPFLPRLTGVRAGTVTDATGENVYPVEINLKNDGKQNGILHLVLDDVDPEGGRRQVTREVILGPEEPLSLRLEMHSPIFVGPDPIVMVSVEDALGSWKSVMHNLEGAARESAIDAYLGRSYYTSEKVAALYFAVDQAPEILLKCKLQITVKDARNKTLHARSKIPIRPGENSVKIPLDQVPAGDHMLQIELADHSGKIVDRTTEKLIKRPPLGKGNEVKADRYNRCVLVNGQPFFPFGVVIMGQHLERIKEEGYNCIMRWAWRYRCSSGEITPAEAAKDDPLLDGAHELGLMVIDRLMNTRHIPTFNYARPNWVTNWEDWIKNDVHAVLPVIQHHPALLAVMAFDEPGDMIVQPGSRRLSEISRDTLKEFTAASGYHPVFHNFNHHIPKENIWREGNDLYSVYIYWFPHSRRGRAIAEITQKCDAGAQADHRPLWVMPITEGRGGPATIMTPREQRANTYLFLVHGARGIYYFWWPNFHRDTFELFQRLSKEVETLAPALLRREPAQTITYHGVPEEEHAVDLALRVMPDGTPIMVLVNKEDFPVDFTCELPWLPRQARLVSAFDESKNIPLSKKVFSQRLPALATRAYRIKGYRIEDLGQEHAIRVTEGHPKKARDQTGENLVGNPGFEENGYWKINSGGKVADYSVGMAPAGEAHSGQHGIKFSRSSEKDPTQSISSPVIQLRPNRRYRFGLWWRTRVTKWMHEKHCGLMATVAHRGGPKPEWLPQHGAKMRHRNWELAALDREFRTGNEPVEVSIYLANWSLGEVWIDDVFLTDMGPAGRESTSKNIVRNSSFEASRLRGYPDCWGPQKYDPWGLGAFIGDPDAPWSLDDEISWHGKYSLRIQGKVRHPTISSGYYRTGFGIAMEEGAKYTVSAYLRADREDLPVKLVVRNLFEDGVTCKVRREWKRYTFTNTFQTTPGTRLSMRGKTAMQIINRGSNGTLWVDAIQIEKGAQATEYEEDDYTPPYPILTD